MNHNKTIWAEKYRPTNFNNIVKQDEIKLFLNGAIRERNIPHLLLYGPPGTGKTTTANSLAKRLFKLQRSNNTHLTKFQFNEENNKLFYDRVLELNASDERGIKVVREKIKTFANLSIAPTNNYNIPPFKIIILDEADAMSADAQFALRRIMEKYSHNTRFILICNYVTKIIPPLASRCSKFRFLPIDLENTKIIIRSILEKEGIYVLIPDDIYLYIYKYTNGDLRKTITLIQSLSFNGLENLTIQMVQRAIGELPIELINETLELLKQGLNSKTQINIFILCKQIINGGFNGLFLVNHLYYHYLYNTNITDNIKSNIIYKLSETDNKLNNGSLELIQLSDMMIYINATLNNVKFKIDQQPFSIAKC